MNRFEFTIKLGLNDVPYDWTMDHENPLAHKTKKCYECKYKQDIQDKKMPGSEYLIKNWDKYRSAYLHQMKEPQEPILGKLQCHGCLKIFNPSDLFCDKTHWQFQYCKDCYGDYCKNA